MKYLRLIIGTIFLFFVPTVSLSNDRCLLIGIGHYPLGSGWKTISSTNDIKLLETTLSDKFQVYTLIDEQATKKGIEDAIDKLINVSDAGDTILIHFSCHGQQVLTSDKNEPDNLDESLIPYDAQCVKSKTYIGQNHLLDNEFGKIIFPLRKKLGNKGLLVITLDACFSDSMNKGSNNDNSGIYRGGADIFGSNEISQDSLRVIEKKRRNQGLGPDVEKMRDGADILILSACRTYQKNMEVVENGVGYGSLSYAMFLTFRTKNFSDIAGWLKGVLSQMSKIAFAQTPQYRTTLSIELVPSPPPSLPPSPPKCYAYIHYIIMGALTLLLIIVILIWKKKKK